MLLIDEHRWRFQAMTRKLNGEGTDSALYKMLLIDGSNRFIKKSGI
jgi:hypothetical protein